MRMLITGAAGFIGSHLAERLAGLGHSVVGLDNYAAYYAAELKKLNTAALGNWGIAVHKIDLRAPEGLDQLAPDFDYIFHLAAQPGISTDCTFEDYLSNNVIGTKNLLDFALRCSNLKLFVNIATSSVYGVQASFDEEKVPEPVSFYGVTKLAAEELILAASREHQLKACSLRLYSVYGPRERPEKLYSKLIAAAFSGEAFPLYKGSGAHLRSFTYVQDIIDGIVSVIGRETAVESQIINIGTEEEHTTQEGIDAIEKITGRTIKIQSVEPRPGDQLRTHAVIGKARRLLGYDPKTTLEDGLRAQVDWYVAHFACEEAPEAQE